MLFILKNLRWVTCPILRCMMGLIGVLLKTDSRREMLDNLTRATEWPDTYSTQYEKYQCYSFFTNTHNPTRFHQTSSPSCCSIFPFNPFLLDKHSLNPGKLQRLLFVDVFFHGRVHLPRKNLHFSPRQMVDWFHASTHWFGAKYLVHSLIYGLNSKYLYNMEYNMGIILIHSIHNWWFKYCNVYIYL